MASLGYLAGPPSSHLSPLSIPRGTCVVSECSTGFSDEGHMDYFLFVKNFHATSTNAYMRLLDPIFCCASLHRRSHHNPIYRLQGLGSNVSAWGWQASLSQCCHPPSHHVLLVVSDVQSPGPRSAASCPLPQSWPFRQRKRRFLTVSDLGLI
jgi:hypothetical protein